MQQTVQNSLHFELGKTKRPALAAETF